MLFTRNNIIIIIIVIIMLICIYLGWKYFTSKTQEKKLIKDDNIITPDDPPAASEDTSYNDQTLYPYFEIEIGGIYAGKVVFQLFDETVPKTCKNFRYLCVNGLFVRDKPSYQNTHFHRVIKEFMIQGGDFTNSDGTGGFSMYGKHFEDENFDLEHNQPGMLSMANSGPNTNNSQFFITTEKTPWLDKKHVVFGIVISGFDIVKKIENLEVDNNSEPLIDAVISKCGLMKPEDLKI